MGSLRLLLRSCPAATSRRSGRRSSLTATRPARHLQRPARLTLCIESYAAWVSGETEPGLLDSYARHMFSGRSERSAVMTRGMHLVRTISVTVVALGLMAQAAQ